MTQELSIGKYRALQRASSTYDIFTVLAIDHLDSLRRVLNPDMPETVSDLTMVQFKQQVVSSLEEKISGVLLDPVYGAAQMISDDLSKTVGLLVELEKADYEMEALPLAVEIRSNWSVEKIKRMSADGVKLFYYYDPDNVDLCQQQDATIKAVVADCKKYDIPLYAEPIVTNTTPDTRQSKVIQSAKQAEALGADILKVEFPLDVSFDSKPSHWKAACKALNDVVTIPWVLLSAGVDFEIFYQQVEIACKAGASGFIVGRAVWGDAVKIADDRERLNWLETIGVQRMQRLYEIAHQTAIPWTSYYQAPTITPEWHENY